MIFSINRSIFVPKGSELVLGCIPKLISVPSEVSTGVGGNGEVAVLFICCGIARLDSIVLCTAVLAF